MAQLTLVRFRVSYSALGWIFFSEGGNSVKGDTTAGLVARLLGTLFGVFVGAAFWFESRVSNHLRVAHHHRYRYISTGTGRGNPYGLAAACGALFPFMMFGRLYWPGPPMTNILFFVTAMLVRGSMTALAKEDIDPHQVIGYSWYNTHPLPPSTFPHWGVDLAIVSCFDHHVAKHECLICRFQRRLILVAVGVAGAL
jgi:hypothetical protein